MPKEAIGISAATVKKNEPGRYGDGGGLYLLVRGPNAKFWSFRYVRSGKMQEIGLGPAVGRDAVSLADARTKARALWLAHKAGRDPLAEKRAGRTIHADASKAVTFEQAADAFITANRADWHNPVHARQWEVTLRTYVYPKIGSMLVSDIKTTHIVDVLLPIWSSKRATADRVRGRIEKILGREKGLEHRVGENPARWRDNLDAVLPRHSKTRNVKPHPAMPYSEIGDFMTKLRDDESIIARALEFCIITASRTSETLGARWDEIDLNERLWIVPEERMKAGRPHRVPLSTRAVTILREMERHRSGDFVFPGRIKGAHLTPNVLIVRLRRLGCKHTTHGFRSAFRDWVGESTNFQSEVAEMALAHIVSDKTERAYRRGDLLAKRFDLAEKWSEFLHRPSIKDSGKKVVSIRGKWNA
jgi:integrase